MPITSQHTATLKAFLSGEQDEYQRLREQLGRESIATDYTTLVAGAFITAVLEKFGEGAAPSEITRWVADIRMRSAEIATDMDPNAAERLIRGITHDEDISDLDDETVVGYQLVLLVGLVNDLIDNERELDEFIERTRAFLAEAT